VTWQLLIGDKVGCFGITTGGIVLWWSKERKQSQAFADFVTSKLLLLLQPFYSSLDYVRDNLGESIPEGYISPSLDFLVQNEDNTGRHTNNPDGLPPIKTNWCPHLYHPHHFCDFKRKQINDSNRNDA